MENKPASSEPFKRRPRYSGKNPRSFEQKYKEHRQDPETLEKVAASGKTPAGTHRPIMLQEILDFFELKPGMTVLDCTLGYGGHSAKMLERILPNGKLLAMDADPLELPKATARLLSIAGDGTVVTKHSNYAGILAFSTQQSPDGVDCILADLGLSSMQIDNPERGFSYKVDGPLDMRMNPNKGISARQYLSKVSAEKLEKALKLNADEPQAQRIALQLAGKDFPTTQALRAYLAQSIPAAYLQNALARIFQAIRIEVNEEFTALDTLLRQIPQALKPGGKVAILSFHSGEDRRVKQAFKYGRELGIYEQDELLHARPSPQECFQNPRATCAKLRWAQKVQ